MISRASYVALAVVAVLITSCSGGGSTDGSPRWATVQSGADASLSWALFRVVLPLPGTPAKGTCLAMEAMPSIDQVPALRQFPRRHGGKETFCGLPTVETTDVVVGGVRVMVVGSNVDATDGWHDAFGLADPDVTKVTATFVGGPGLDAHLDSGTFVLTWQGPKMLDKITAFVGDMPAAECSPPGRRQTGFLNVEPTEANRGLFGCGARA